MNTAFLYSADLALSIVAASLWLACAALTPALPSITQARRSLLLMLCAAAATLVQVLIVLALSPSGWWFVQDKVVFALPLTLVATALAVALAFSPLRRIAFAREQAGTPNSLGGPAAPQSISALARTALFTAASAATAGVLVRVLIGYPLTLEAAIPLLLLIAISAGLSYVSIAQRGRRATVGLAALGVLVLVASGTLAWMGSLAPLDLAPGQAAHASHAASAQLSGATSHKSALSTLTVDELRTPSDAPGPRQRFTLTAATENVTLASGAVVQSWNYGSLPGPELRVQQGDVVEVELRNRDVEAGVTIHWHGYDVPNGEDGVAGITQNAVLPGQSFSYRFVADQAGSYWYHTHQNSSEGVQRGLYGTLIVEPTGGIAEQHDVVAAVHSFEEAVVFGTQDTPTTQPIPVGETVRVRLMNTDQDPLLFQLSGASFRVVSADGTELEDPGEIREKSLRIAAGGRLDLAFTMPAEQVFITTDATSSAWFHFTPTSGAGAPQATVTVAGPPTLLGLPELDLLHYGGGAAAARPSGPRVSATMVLDRTLRFMQGSVTLGNTVNGAVYPQVPSIVVREGDVVELTVVNRSFVTHPMHIHGHHVTVLSRNGEKPSGSALSLDTFDVQPGEVWVVTFTADNPGIWMDHCHNLIHAANGMMMTLQYRGVNTPFEHGGIHRNRSE